MKVVLLAGKSSSSSIVYNYLSREISFSAVIIENKVPVKQLLQRRIKKLGFVKVVGQVLFQTTIVKLLQTKSTSRIEEILSQNSLKSDPIPEDRVTSVCSVNDDQVIQILKQLSPDIVVVNGTRIISRKVLDAVPAAFINMHVGITPGYRGVHGAYWALVNDDRSNAGVTIHYIDPGIDTGKVIAQDTINFTSKDNFVTYPYLQTAKGLKLMLSTINSLKEGGEVESFPKVSFSKLWSHPTIWEYTYYYFAKGVK